MHVESPSMKSSPYLQDKYSAHLPITFPPPLLRIQIAWISHWDNCQWPIMWPVFQVLATIGSLNSTISKESAQVVLEPVAQCGGVVGRTVEVSTWWGHQQGLGRTDTGQLGGSQLRPLRIPAPLLTHPPLSWTTTLSTNIRGKRNKVFDFNTVCVQL